jgi:putative NADH-flavin reductase
MSLFKNIAIVGGSGTLGQHFVKAIHGEGDRFSLTVITRKAGEHQFPAGIKVIEVGDYSEKNDLLREALVGQDVLIAAHNGEFAPAGKLPQTQHANSIT